MHIFRDDGCLIGVTYGVHMGKPRLYINLPNGAGKIKRLQSISLYMIDFWEVYERAVKKVAWHYQITDTKILGLMHETAHAFLTKYNLSTEIVEYSQVKPK